MTNFIFHSEYQETLDLFFEETISGLQKSGFLVETCVVNSDKLFASQSISCTSLLIRSSRLINRVISVSRFMIRSSINRPKAIHVYVLPLHIILAPFISFFFRSSYVVVSQGQLEGEGWLIATSYRILLSFSAMFARSAFSCNIFETFRWNIWPLSYLSKLLKPLPWYGLALNSSKFNNFRFLLPCRSTALQSPIVFGYLGRLCHSKGCHDLINFFSSTTGRKYRLLMTGPIAQSFTSAFSLPPNIELLPPISPSDVPHWFSRIDIFITLSKGESIGASSLEALLSGKPVISRINSGSLQVLRHCIDSYLINDSSQQSLTEAINYVILNFKSMSRAAYQLSEIELPHTCLLAMRLLQLTETISHT